MIFPVQAVTKTAPLKFMGIDLNFQLSHALFSSFKIDDGTMLLLKTLAQQKAVPETGRVLDSGCGVGSLAVALKKRFPGIEMHANDRLMLACAFTLENARRNKVELSATPGLLMEGDSGKYDLIVSNIPAKAGSPVIADALARAGRMITATGRVAIVIVTPLAEWARTTLDAFGAEILLQEDSHDYRVIHYRFSAQAAALEGSSDLPFATVYRRDSMCWDAPSGNIEQATFWGLPNFDALDYRLQVSLELLEIGKWQSPALVWEPGQGHSSSALAQVLKISPTLAGNDWLALRAAAFNLEKQNFGPVTSLPAPSLGSLQELPAGSFQSLIINLYTEPKIKWTEETLQAIRHLAAIGANILISGSSTDLARFLENHQGLKLLRDSKYRGWRAVLLERTKDRSSQ